MKNIANKKPFVLLGMMGCGKSHIGRVLSEKMGLRFVDMDALIEKQENASIAELFDTKGEAYFRDLEADLLGDLLGQEDILISSGGGVVLREDNRDAIQACAFSIWIKSDVDILFERLRHDSTRPLLRSDNLRERLTTLINERCSLYSIADIHVENNQNGEDAVLSVVDEIIAAYKEHVSKSS